MSAFSLPPFANQALWHQAMTHSSFANEHPEAGEHNERLEFLGDAILTFLSGAYLYERYPDRSEGELTPMRAALVDKPQLSHFAQLLGLGNHLQLGKGANREGSRHSARLLCSAFEAMIGAYFLDTGGNVQAVNHYVVPLFDTVVEAVAEQGINAKSQLQEWAHKSLKKTPEYVLIDSQGPDHAKAFTVEVRIDGVAYGQGQAKSKKEAEKAAARAALAAL